MFKATIPNQNYGKYLRDIWAFKKLNIIRIKN